MLPKEGSRKSTSIDSLAVYASRKKQYVMLAIQGKTFARLNGISVQYQHIKHVRPERFMSA
jgi:hypothetical protein